MLREEERAESGEHGQRGLDQVIVGGPGEEHRKEADGNAGDEPAAGGLGKDFGGLERPDAAAGSCAAHTSISVNSTVAAPSLNRLSDFDQHAEPAGHPDSRRSAITEIGSVAAISAPNARADSIGQAEPLDEPPGDDRGADHDADGRQREDRKEVALELASSAGSAPPRTGAAAGRRRR